MRHGRELRSSRLHPHCTRGQERLTPERQGSASCCPVLPQTRPWQLPPRLPPHHGPAGLQRRHSLCAPLQLHHPHWQSCLLHLHPHRPRLVQRNLLLCPAVSLEHSWRPGRARRRWRDQSQARSWGACAGQPPTRPGHRTHPATGWAGDHPLLSSRTQARRWRPSCAPMPVACQEWEIGGAAGLSSKATGGRSLPLKHQSPPSLWPWRPAAAVQQAASSGP